MVMIQYRYCTVYHNRTVKKNTLLSVMILSYHICYDMIPAPGSAAPTFTLTAVCCSDAVTNTTGQGEHSSP